VSTSGAPPGCGSIEVPESPLTAGAGASSAARAAAASARAATVSARAVTVSARASPASASAATRPATIAAEARVSCHQSAANATAPSEASTATTQGARDGGKAEAGDHCCSAPRSSALTRSDWAMTTVPSSSLRPVTCAMRASSADGAGAAAGTAPAGGAWSIGASVVPSSACAAALPAARVSTLPVRRSAMRCSW
jgi:hypothetical protein